VLYHLRAESRWSFEKRNAARICRGAPRQRYRFDGDALATSQPQSIAYEGVLNYKAQSKKIQLRDLETIARRRVSIANWREEVRV
jgi:hypothetical protein